MVRRNTSDIRNTTICEPVLNLFSPSVLNSFVITRGDLKALWIGSICCQMVNKLLTSFFGMTTSESSSSLRNSISDFLLPMCYKFLIYFSSKTCSFLFQSFQSVSFKIIKHWVMIKATNNNFNMVKLVPW